MSPRQWTERLNDILEAIEKIETYTISMDCELFSHDPKTIDAVLRNFEVIGEAATHIPDGIREKFPEFPLMELRAIRNIIVHEYFGVSLPIIWDSINKDLPGLKKLIKMFLLK